MEIVRKELTADELYPPYLRYNAGTDEVEYSPDGGTTWIPAPEQDPRNMAFVPPPDTADPACDGAERITEHYQELVATVIVGAVGGTTAVVARLLALLFPAFALLIIVITLVVEGLLAIGAEAIAEAFLGDEWDNFKCIVYANIGTDGFVTEAGFANIRSEVNSTIGGTAATVINLLMDATGYGGMNDAAGQRSETGDCSSCDEWCYPLDFTTDDYGFVLSVLNGGEWVSGTGLRTTNTSVSGLRTLLQGTITLPSLIEITHAAIVYDWATSGCTSCATNGSLWGYGTVDGYEHTSDDGNPCTTTPGTDLVQHINVPDSVQKVVIDFQTSFTCYGGEAVVKHINLFGTDEASLAALVSAFGAAECV